MPLPQVYGYTERESEMSVARPTVRKRRGAAGSRAGPQALCLDVMLSQRSARRIPFWDVQAKLFSVLDPFLVRKILNLHFSAIVLF